MIEHNDNGKFLFGLFLGGLIGALLIFFLGTKEGKKAGKLLEKKGKDILDEVEDRLDELEERGKELVAQGVEIKEQVMEKLDEKREELTESAVEKIDSALAHLEEMQQKGAETTALLRRRFKNLPKKS